MRKESDKKIAVWNRIKDKGNWSLIYEEEFNTREEAIQREKQLKSYQGRKFIRNIIEKN